MDIKSKKLKKAGVKVIDKTSQKFKIKAPDGKYNKYAKIFKINVWIERGIKIWLINV